MKVTKPMKLSVVFRAVEQARRAELHVGAVIGFSLANTRSLVDEISFWPAVMPSLGGSALDEAYAKAYGEVLVGGSCFAPGGKEIPASFVRLQMGAIDKRLSVIGDRYWRHGMASNPEPFVEMPVDWAHAFGGADYAQNPYGKGTLPVDHQGDKVTPLPNIEPFGALMRSQSSRPAPAGFMPMDPSFIQRRSMAGTFGSDYVDKWAPGLPPDHDPGFYNLAPADQRITGQWAPDEAFLIENMHPEKIRIEGKLPGLVPRAFVSQRVNGEAVFRELSLHCDTVWFFPSTLVGAVIFRARLPVSDYDAADVEHLLLACEEMGSPRSVEHYQAARARRLDKDDAALSELSDSDIMPDRASGVAANLQTDVGLWVKSENLFKANMDRGAMRNFERARAAAIENGADAETIAAIEAARPVPPAPPPGDIDELVEYMAKELKNAKDLEKTREAEIDARIAEAKAKTAAVFGEDRVTDVEDVQGGPPRIDVDGMFANIREAVEKAREHGQPSAELEAQLADPKMRATMEEHQRELREVYRQSAHLGPPAPPMPPEANQLATTLIEVARTASEALSERDLTGADLRECDLSGLDLHRSFLEGADLRGVKLDGADLEGTVLARADLRGASLRGCRLAGANLGGANLEGATLDEADLSNAILMNAKVRGATFARADFSGAEVMNVGWAGVDLRGAKLAQCSFIQADLSGADLSGADLTRITFMECTLDGANFTGANLQKATFVSTKGTGVRFTRANCSEAVFAYQDEFPEADFTDAILEPCCLRTTRFPRGCFDRARMAMADLSECDLSNATFSQAQLKSALLIRSNLDGASLRGANLLEAILTKASLRGTDFTGTLLTRADFMRAKGDQKTSFADAVVKWTRFDKEGSAPTR
ncbi:MAG: DUF2169 domain-containing protein [Polyangiaceae bacterium]